MKKSSLIWFLIAMITITTATTITHFITRDENFTLMVFGSLTFMNFIAAIIKSGFTNYASQGIAAPFFALLAAFGSGCMTCLGTVNSLVNYNIVEKSFDTSNVRIMFLMIMLTILVSSIAIAYLINITKYPRTKSFFDDDYQGTYIIDMAPPHC